MDTAACGQGPYKKQFAEIYTSGLHRPPCGLGLADSVLLMQLRTGSCARVGGHLYGQPTYCWRCGKQLRAEWERDYKRLSDHPEEDPAPIAHVFNCPNFRTTLAPEALWKQPEQAIAFVRSYLEGKPNRNPRVDAADRE